MKPIVHGFEKQYEKRLDVLYFDISDKTYDAAQRRLRFRSTPHFILLRRDGSRVQEWTGVVVPEGELRTAIDALLNETR